VTPFHSQTNTTAVALAQGSLVLLVGWGVLAFGAVYPWGYWPLVVASVVVAALVGAAGHAIDPTAAERCIGLGLGLFAVGAMLQLVPLPVTTLGRVAPETVQVLQRMDLAVASRAVQVHELSIAPRATLVGISLFVAFAILGVATTVLFSAHGARGFARALVVLGAVVATIGIVQQPMSTGKIYGFWTTIDGGTPYGPFVNRNHFAGWMLMALPVTLGLLLGSLSRAMRGVRARWRDRLVWFSSAEASQLILLSAAAVVMALVLVLTMSRSGVTSFALAMTLTGAIVARRKWTGGRSGVALVYLGFLVIVVISWVGADVLASRFSDTDWNELNARRGAWADANDIRSRFPLAGTGLNTYGTATVLYQQHDRTHRYTEAHNDYLQLAAEGGLLLMIPAAVCVIAFAVAVRRRFLEETSAMSYWLRVGAVTGIASIALQETVEFSLQMPGNAALFAVLCGIALHRAPARRKT
jgi:O-antigen ligase